MARAQPKKPSRNVVKTTPVALYDYGDDAGIGAEDISPDDFLLPFARIADPKSPQVQKRVEQYIPGLQPGQFFNVTSRRVYGDSSDDENGFPFTLHVCAKRRGFAEFIPRESDGSGGGFVGQHPEDYELALKLQAEQGQRGRLETPDGTELAETHYLFCLVCPSEDYPDPDPIIIPASSTHITPVKQLMMKLNPLIRKGVPIFAPRIRVSSKFRQRAVHAWYVPSFEFDGTSPEEYLIQRQDPLYNACLELRESAVSGRARADFEAQTDVPHSGDDHPAF